MPFNCPIQLIPFLAGDACDTCPSYDEKTDYCYKAKEPLKNILTIDERLDRTERLIKKLQEGERALPDKVWYKRLGQVK